MKGFRLAVTVGDCVCALLKHHEPAVADRPNLFP
jgi:hypothetical protein